MTPNTFCRVKRYRDLLVCLPNEKDVHTLERIAIALLEEARDIYDIAALCHLYLKKAIPSLPFPLSEDFIPIARNSDPDTIRGLSRLTLCGIVPIQMTNGYRSKNECHRSVLRFYMSRTSHIFWNICIRLHNHRDLLHSIIDTNGTCICPVKIPSEWQRYIAPPLWTKNQRRPLFDPGSDAVYYYSRRGDPILAEIVKRHEDGKWEMERDALVTPPIHDAYCPKIPADRDRIALVSIYHKSYNIPVLPILLQILN